MISSKQQCGRLAAALMVSSLVSIAPANAATPASGALSDTSQSASYASGPFLISNASGTAGAVMCQAPVLVCDEYSLIVNLSPAYVAAHPGIKLTVATAWPNTTEDFDLYLLDAGGNELVKSASSSDPESLQIDAVAGVTTYTVRIVPYTVAGGNTLTSIALVTPAAPQPQLLPTGLPPRFKIDASPAALGNSAGEPSIGYNYKSRNGMFISALQTLRLTFPWNQPDPIEAGKFLPEACDANWTDVSFLTTSIETLDPILHTNSRSGRTFVSQITTGPNLLFAYTDNDGANWTPAGAGPPSGTEDHQTVGTGPYPAGSPFAAIAQAAGVDYATYYCGQTDVTAFCARSDNGGVSFGSGVPIYSTQVDCGSPIGALHGHVKVSPDGTVYVPPKDCGGQQAVIASADAGLTWATRKLPNTDADSEIDPSVATAADNTVYDCYVAKSGHPHVQVSKDRGLTWINDYDIGASQGIQLATFPEAVAGDPDRASCAFIGSTTAGNHDALDYPGIWYGFVATTYDGGKSWHTVNVTPKDPVQGVGGICNAGTLTCGANRNLLDFNEITTDEFGRVLFGFADGCTGACVQDPVNANAFAQKATVARQTGGRPLFSKFDTIEPRVPAASCLAGQRTASRSRLNWKAPDTGGALVSSYNIYRGTSVATIGSKPIAKTAPKTSYDDTTVSSTVAHYFYRITALNTRGEGIASNVVDLPVLPDPVVETACTTPGITIVTDSPGDASPQLASVDLLSLSAAEPPTLAGKIVFTVKVASLAAPLPPATYWYVLTQDKARNNLYLAMDTSAVTPQFTYGTYADASAGVLTFTQAGTLDPLSGYNADGTITLVAPKTIFGNLLPGDFITPIDARTRVGLPSVPSRDVTGSGTYQVRAADACVVLLPPTASLAANVQRGKAPLTVAFDGSGSTTPNQGAAIQSYTFDFGDGTTIITQASPRASHIYTVAGTYPAKLKVTDTRNQTSINTASRFIDVTAKRRTED